MTANTNETVALLKSALAKSNDALADTLQKNWTQSSTATTGLTAYDLEAPAKTLYPVLTPLRNLLPRVSGSGGIQANWKAVTAINTGKMFAGVTEGLRNATISTSVVDYLAAYRGLGLEDSVTFEAQYAGEGFEDVRARATQGLLRSLMIEEEYLLLGGNTSNALTTTPTPTATPETSGGALADATYYVVCVALTNESFRRSSVANGVVAQMTRTTADGTTETVNVGAAQKSVQSSGAAVSGGSGAGSVQASVAAVRGAVGYAWFWGTTTGATVLGAITTINSVLITAAAGGSQVITALPSSDCSTSGLTFDGYLTFAAKSSSNGYYAAQATGTVGTGTPLTAGTDGTISEIDTALKWFWDTYRLSPTTIWCSSQEMNFIRKKVLTGGTAAAQRFVFQLPQNGLIGGTSIKSYLNPFTMDGSTEIPIKQHPYLPAGTILFTTETIPYPLSGVVNVAQVKTRQEYYSVEWPRRARKYEYGVYVDEVLQHYAPFALGTLTNIGAG